MASVDCRRQQVFGYCAELSDLPLSEVHLYPDPPADGVSFEMVDATTTLDVKNLLNSHSDNCN